MIRFTKAQTAKLIYNWQYETALGGRMDFSPVVKLFTPGTDCVWLLTEIIPGHSSLFFGLADLGNGRPRLRSIPLSELTEPRGKLGLSAEIDHNFKAAYAICVYTEAAYWAKRITFEASDLRFSQVEIDFRYGGGWKFPG